MVWCAMVPMCLTRRTWSREGMVWPMVPICLTRRTWIRVGIYVGHCCHMSDQKDMESGGYSVGHGFHISDKNDSVHGWYGVHHVAIRLTRILERREDMVSSMSSIYPTVSNMSMEGMVSVLYPICLIRRVMKRNGMVLSLPLYVCPER